MKKIKIGNIELDQCETTSDLSANRYTAFKCHIIEDESGIPIPKLSEMFKQFSAEFDKGSMSGMYIKMHNFLRSLQNAHEGFDSMQLAYALLVYEEGEDRNHTDKHLLKEKIDRLSKEGLTQGIVEDVVTSFLDGLMQR